MDTTSPDDTVHTAFAEQATAKLIADAEAYARRRARGLSKCGSVECQLASDLVGDALHDTFEGIVRWDPRRKPLLQHINDVVRQRTHNLLRRAERYPHTSTSEVDVAVIEARLSAVESNPRLISLAEEVLETLRRCATNDADVLALLDAYEAGAVKKTQVMQGCAMPAAAYARARKRLTRMLDDCPDLLEAVVRDRG